MSEDGVIGASYPPHGIPDGPDPAPVVPCDIPTLSSAVIAAADVYHAAKAECSDAAAVYATKESAKALAHDQFMASLKALEACLASMESE